MKDNGFKLSENGFQSDIRMKFFPMRMLRYRNRLSREAVKAPSLELFRANLDEALSNLVLLEVSLVMSGNRTWD